MSLVEPQIVDMIRLARHLALHDLTVRQDAPHLTTGSLVSTHPEIQGRIDDVVLGFGLLTSEDGRRRGVMLGGWGLVVE